MIRISTYAAAIISAIAPILVVGVSPSAAQTKVVPDSLALLTLSYAPIVKQAAPAVVNVYTSRVVQRQNFSPFFDDPFFRRFFGNQGQEAPSSRVQNSLGSGVIFDESGLIITNAHVIEGADEVKVALADRREFPAKIVLSDARTDLAVLQIGEEGPFPFLEFGDSDRLEVGDIVLAIGDPFGVGQTVTSGIVSALARTQIGVSDYGFFIQTDAAINPGNSGGALLDMQGRVVGINSAIFSRSGGSQGIGFAIPSNMVKLVVASLQDGGVFTRPWFGASVQEVTPDIAESLGMDRPVGVLIGNLHPAGPAAKAGLGTGDVIVAVEGREVLDPNSFRYRLDTRGVDTSTQLTVISRGKSRFVDVALVVPPEDPPRDERELSGPTPFAGIRIANMSPAVAEELSLDSGSTGVVVVSIARTSAAERVGFKVGDLIYQINGESIESSARLDKLVQERKRSWSVTIIRGGRQITSVLNG